MTHTFKYRCLDVDEDLVRVFEADTIIRGSLRADGAMWDVVAKWAALDFYCRYAGEAFDWPLRFALIDEHGEIARFEVSMELTPQFDAREIEAPEDGGAA